ncbi:MAG TPA: DUF2279 domain-containing protein [Kofleriaceae bacterium]|nr:DUF2279 domain-containing protein [Kofleriaceae bacterium]
MALAGATAHAQPQPDAPPPPRPNLTLGQDPSPTTDVSLSPKYHPLRAELTVGGMYAAFAGWMYFAWYQHHKGIPYKFGGDDENCGTLHGLSRWFSGCALIGWAGDTTYAGGEDKFGHAWSTMALARLTDEILEQWGGFGHQTSVAIGTTLSWLTFVGVEVRDGFNFEFSYSDLGGDTVGALVGLALMEFPRLDEMFDFRVQYFPSQMYLRKLDGQSPCPYGTCSRWDIAEDYSGQKYLLAFHLSSIHSLRDYPKYGFLSRFVDLAVGFDTRNYKPTPDAVLMERPRQEGFIAVSFNAQGFFDWLLENGSHQTLRKVTHGLGEVFNLPYTSLNFFTVQHSPCPTCQVATDGAL